MKFANPKEIFQSAYESRYCWPKNFSGYQGNCTYIKNMNFSRYFALMLVEASKVGKDEHLRKVQSDVLAQLKHSKNKN